MQNIAFNFFATLVGPHEAEHLAARSDLISADGAVPDSLDLPTFWRLCAENIQSHNDESHGVAIVPVPRGSLSVLFMSAKDADTLGEAADRLADTAKLIRKECQIITGKSRQGLHLTMRPLGRTDARAEIYMECFAIVTHCALRWMTGRRLDPLLVRGAASLATTNGTLLASLNVPLVRRGEGVTLHYARDDMNAPILSRKYTAWGDQEFESFLALLHERDEINGAERSPVTRTVRAHLTAGMRSEDAVSAAMHMSVATLRRRLSNEAVSFRQLSAEVRREHLLELLATDIEIEDMARKLGLSDERSLRRFCQDSLGMSPSRYRRLLRGSPA